MLEKAHVDKRVLSYGSTPTGLDTLDALIDGERDDSPLDAPGHHTRIIILTSGTTGTPKGAPRNEAGIDAAISLLSRMPLQVRLDRAHRRAAVPHLGLRAHDAVAAARPHAGAEAEVRPRGRARGDRREALRRGRGDPGDAAADARPRGRRARQVLAAHGQGGRGLRLGAAGRPGADLDGPLRRQPLQHLRLHRGRLRLDRDARGHAHRAVHRRQAAVGHRREDLRRQGPGGPGRRVRPDLRRQQPALRGLHRRRPEGHDRRADELRRRRPLRRRRAGCTSTAATTT